MPRRKVLLLAAGLLLAACDQGDGPSIDGTLVISTFTVGADPDPDGYLLTIDGLDSLSLDPSDTAEIPVSSGQHRVQLLGIAEHCSVGQGTSVDVDVPSRGSISVAFEVSCPTIGVRITTTTTGLDIDSEYRVTVDGTDRGRVPSNGTVLARLVPGSRTIALEDLAPNCKIDGDGSRTVTVGDPEIVLVEFTVVCTATNGVIAVVFEASGPDADGLFEAMLDGLERVRIRPGVPYYLTGVPAGEHVISVLGPPNCAMEPDQQPATITTGKLIRDTIEVSFSAACEPRPEGAAGTARITAPTSGQLPSSTRYEVWYETFPYWDYGGPLVALGDLTPNDTLMAELPVSGGIHYWYRFYLKGVPQNCSVGDPHPYPLPGFVITYGDTLDVELAIRCPA
jgi:hypothetical protein